ncbi:unnamed protein product [Amoebophrya sp. A120]|nr:unnamed protein product [Amoebophrya sp. A120]|eukprot:GSA120T00018881001.1
MSCSSSAGGRRDSGTATESSSRSSFCGTDCPCDQKTTASLTDLEPPTPLDLLVIGAGPHALSLLTRLIDDEPDLMTELERSYIMENSKRFRSFTQVRNHLKKKFENTSTSTLVVDTHGRWMAQWEADFDAFGIHHLRSHEHLHPDPHDFQALAVWADMQRREAELREMRCVDRDQCRHKGYYGPFVTPSTKLFLDFCANVVDRYGLGDVVTKGTVQEVRILEENDLLDEDQVSTASPEDLELDSLETRTQRPNGTTTEPSPSAAGLANNPAGMKKNNKKLSEVFLADGRRFLAKHVVCAMGPGPAFQGMRATLPWWAEGLEKALAAAGKDAEEYHIVDEFDAEDGRSEESSPKKNDLLQDGQSPTATTKASTRSSSSSSKIPIPIPHRMQHSQALSNWLREPISKQVLENRKVLVVGGGQTSAHLAQLALVRGCAAVTLCSRRQITKKPYDVDVAYVGYRRPHFLQKFWQLEDFRRRKEFNAKLRAGGSMSADTYSELINMSSRSRSSSDKFDDEEGEKRQMGSLELTEENEVVQAHWCSSDQKIHIRFEDGKLQKFDFVWLATGGNFDMELVPVFAALQKQHPIPCIDGLPQLQPDLRWAKDVPLYVMGAFAQLQLGADALNLAGARSGGVVVARALLEAGVGGGQQASSSTSRLADSEKYAKKKAEKEMKRLAKKGANRMVTGGRVDENGEWVKRCCPDHD